LFAGEQWHAIATAQPGLSELERAIVDAVAAFHRSIQSEGVARSARALCLIGVQPGTRKRRRPLMQSFFAIITGAAAAGLGVVEGLLHRQWLSAGVCACILLVAVATTKPEPTNTFHDHARRALRTAGMLSAMVALLAAASFAIPSNRETPITVIFFAAVVGGVFGGGAYVAITAFRAAWDAAIAGMRGHR
jgi:hypothetical protein